MLSKSKINKIKLINNKKNLRLDKFIKLALYEKNGYYLSKKPIGRKFDFVTSPEISQMFGEIIGVYLVYYWKEKINSKFNLIGIPFQLILGKKSEGDTFEFKEVGKETQNLKIEEIITQIKKAKLN